MAMAQRTNSRPAPCAVHYVFAFKQHHPPLTLDALNRIKQACQPLCRKRGATILDINANNQQLHFLVQHPPSPSPSALLTQLNTITSQLLHQEFPHATTHPMDPQLLRCVRWKRTNELTLTLPYPSDHPAPVTTAFVAQQPVIKLPQWR